MARPRPWRRVARYIYEGLPLPRHFRYQLISLVYRVGGPRGWFDGMVHYEEWRRNFVVDFPALDISGPVPADEYAERLQGLRFEAVAHPLVSVFIPAYGRLDQTLMCLLSIARHPPRVPIEIIVAEDASGDQDILRLREVPGLRFHENPQNLGFLRSCNQALTLARGEYVFFLNNDTEVMAGWLDSLLRLFEQRADCGLAGSKLVYPDGRLQEAGGIVWANGGGMNYGRLQDPRRGLFNYVKEVDYISGAAILLRAAVFRELGGFDEHYLPAYCEDSDLAFRVRQKGLKVLYQPRSVVVHYEGVSHGTSTRSGIKAHQLGNQKKLFERWQAELAREHFPPGSNIFQARDRSRYKPCILVIDRYIPQPDRDAGSRTIWCFLQLLVGQGMNVKFWPQDLIWDGNYGPALQDMGIEVFYGPDCAGRLDQWLARHGGCLDYVLVSRPNVAADVMPSLRRLTGAKIIYYGHDLHFARLQNQYEVSHDPELLIQAEEIKQQEMAAWRSADVVYYPSRSEVDAVLALCPGVLARAVPAFFYDVGAGLMAVPGTRRDIIFVAGFGHAPNSDAAEWFVQEVLPCLQAVYPDIHLTLAGSSPTAAVQALAGPAVTVTGYISDQTLADLYGKSRVAVVPLRYGAGVKGKVLEALSFQLPLVTTSVGLQGLPELEAVVGAHDEAREFAGQVLHLLQDDAAWSALVEQGLQYLREYFSRDAMWQVFASDIDPSPRNKQGI